MKYSFKSSNLLNTLYCRVSLLFLIKNFFFVTKCKINKKRFKGSTSTDWFFVYLFPGWLVFEETGKPEYPEKNLSDQRREPTTNSTHMQRRRLDSNPGHIGGRRVLSPLRHPCSPLVCNMFLSFSQFFSISIIACRTCLIFQDGRSEEIEPYN